MVKILVAAGLYPPDIGGPATYAKMLEEVLPPAGFELQVLPFGEVRKYPKLFRHVIYAWRLWRHAKDSDVVYALDQVSVGLPALLVSKLARKPFLVRLGGDYAWEQGQQRFGVTATLDEYTDNKRSMPRPVKWLASVQSLVTRSATKVIVPSDYMKGIASTWNKNNDNIVRIYSVLHSIEVSGSKEELRQQLEYTKPTIVTAARLVPWKGVEALLDVTKELSAVYDEIELVVIGSGSEEEKLKLYAKENGLSDRVRFTGSLAKEALGAAVKAADVFVLNTAYEGMSHQLLEVMDLEVPIVTTKVGGNPELITDRESGLLVTFNDRDALAKSIDELLKDDFLREKLVAKAKVRTVDFEKELVTKQLIELLQSVTKA